MVMPYEDGHPTLRFKTIIISDTHLGKKAASAAFLFEFLQHSSCQRLILNGDILEGWGLKRKKRKPFPEMHTRCMDALNGKAATGTEVIYLRGNHDEDWAKGKKTLANQTIAFQDKEKDCYCPITFRKSYPHTDAQGRVLLVLHGDVFDGFMRSSKKKIIAQYADHAYEGLVHINGIVRQSTHDLTGWHISPAAYLKRKTKKMLGIIGNFEDAVTSKNMTKRFDGVVCGHIHHAEITQKPDMLYMNSGDWVESCTALVEDFDGNWKIVDWAREREHLGLRSVPTMLDKNPYSAYRGVSERQLNLARLLWPGKDFGELTSRLRECRKTLSTQQQQLSEIFEKAADNDNSPYPKKVRKLVKETDKTAEEIQKIENRISPHPQVVHN